MEQRSWGRKDTVKFFRAHAFLKWPCNLLCVTKYIILPKQLYMKILIATSHWSGSRLLKKKVSIKFKKKKTYFVEPKLYSPNCMCVFVCMSVCVYIYIWGILVLIFRNPLVLMPSNTLLYIHISDSLGMVLISPGRKHFNKY